MLGPRFSATLQLWDPISPGHRALPHCTEGRLRGQAWLPGQEGSAGHSSPPGAVGSRGIVLVREAVLAWPAPIPSQNHTQDFTISLALGWVRTTSQEEGVKD